MFNEILLISLLYAVSFTLLFMEVAIIPGFGIAGVAGIALLIIGCLATWVFFGRVAGIVSLLSSLTLSALSVYLAFTSKSGKKFILDNKLSAASGVREGISLTRELIGKEGIAITPLRPSGTVEIGDKRFDVISEGDFINIGDSVIVREIRGNYLVVERTEVG